MQHGRSEISDAGNALLAGQYLLSLFIVHHNDAYTERIIICFTGISIEHTL